MKCNKCNTEEKVHLSLSFTQLFFGGFPVRMVYRCEKCEKELSKDIEKILNDKSKTRNTR